MQNIKVQYSKYPYFLMAIEFYFDDLLAYIEELPDKSILEKIFLPDRIIIKKIYWSDSLA